MLDLLKLTAVAGRATLANMNVLPVVAHAAQDAVVLATALQKIVARG